MKFIYSVFSLFFQLHLDINIFFGDDSEAKKNIDHFWTCRYKQIRERKQIRSQFFFQQICHFHSFNTVSNISALKMWHWKYTVVLKLNLPLLGNNRTIQCKNYVFIYLFIFMLFFPLFFFLFRFFVIGCSKQIYIEEKNTQL